MGIAYGRVLGWNNDWMLIKDYLFRREGGESLIVARQRMFTGCLVVSMRSKKMS